jgi:hypothetical protein
LAEREKERGTHGKSKILLTGTGLLMEGPGIEPYPQHKKELLLVGFALAAGMAAFLIIQCTFMVLQSAFAEGKTSRYTAIAHHSYFWFFFIHHPRHALGTEISDSNPLERK